MWSWYITYLPTSVRGVWLYLYLVIDVWSRKVVAWDIAEREEAQIDADLVSRACLRERISKDRSEPLILHADKRQRNEGSHSGKPAGGVGCPAIVLQAAGQ